MGAAQSRAAAIAALEARLGYVFDDRALLEQALTHASTQSQGRSNVLHNERLEFLGDRVLGLTVAQALYETYPEGDPALLTKHLNYLVSREVCAEVARAIGIDQAFAVQKEAGLRRNDTALSDTCEAVIAAVYVEAGFERARQAVLGLWSEALTRPFDSAAVNPKNTLQEWAQAAGKPLPVYHVINRVGPPHAPVFTVEALVDGFGPAQASGRSRQEAEKAAAQALLKREGAL
ncbi:MAG TPA: ribonuclease III [Caulobacteraceae bacterium]|jgi:ribonuclease-3